MHKYTSTELAFENKYVVRHVRKLRKYCDYATKLFLILILVCYLTVFFIGKVLFFDFFYSNSTFSISFIVSTFHCPKFCSIQYISIFIYTLMTKINDPRGLGKSWTLLTGELAHTAFSPTVDTTESVTYSLPYPSLIHCHIRQACQVLYKSKVGPSLQARDAQPWYPS